MRISEPPYGALTEGESGGEHGGGVKKRKERRTKTSSRTPTSKEQRVWGERRIEGRPRMKPDGA